MPSGLRLPRLRSTILPLLGGTTLVTVLIAGSLSACGAKKATFGDGTGGGTGDDGSVSDDGGINFNNNNPSNLNLEGGSNNGGNANSMCKGGFYEGQFGGLYWSHLAFGFPLPVTGDVRMTLQQSGTGTKMCTFAGETESCSSFFSVQNGTIDGIADAVRLEGGLTVGGFPYHCVLTGTLSCPKKKLVNGWINCTYCVGDLNDGGMSCVNGGSGNGAAGGGLTGTGGQFGGPLTSDYFYNSTGGTGGAGAIDGGGKDPAPAFGTIPPPVGGSAADYDPGAWNGAESLFAYGGMGPLPEGGMVSDYLSDAGYGRFGVMNDYGGDGWWWAQYQHP